MTQSRPVAEEYGDQAPSTQPSVLARQLCARERTKTVVCRGARSGTYQPQDGLPWNGTGYVPGSDNETTSHQATALRSELNGQAARLRPIGSSRPQRKGNPHLSSLTGGDWLLEYSYLNDQFWVMYS